MESVDSIPFYFHGVISEIHKTYFAFLICTLWVQLSYSQTSKVQFIHNCIDDSIGTVDVWVNEQIWSNDLNAHHATPLQTVIDSAVWSIRHPDDSSIIYYTWNALLALNSRHIFSMQGNLDASSYAPFRPLAVHQFEGALEQSGSNSSIDVIFLHGTSDLDSIEIQESQLFQLTAFDSIGFGDYTGYLPLFTADYGWSVVRESDSSFVAEFSLPISDLNWAGRAITLVTSGFFNQRNNNEGESFGIWATTSAGGAMVKLEPLRWNITSEVQFAHNSSFPGSENIEITCDGILWQTELNVHEATPFSPFPSGKEVEVCMNAILANGQTENLWCDTLLLLSGQDYQLIWFGGESPSVDAQLYTREWSLSESISPDSLHVALFNGSAAWPSLSIRSDSTIQFPIIENVSFAGLSNSVSLPNVEEEWILYSASDSLTALRAPFGTATYAQQQLTALTFPDGAGNLPSIWICLPDGGQMARLETIILPELPVFCQLQLVHASADTLLSEIDIWLNDSLWFPSFEFETATAFITVPCNDPVSIRVTPVGDSLITISETTYYLEANQLHRLFLWGIFDQQHYNPSPPLAWHVETDASISAENNDEFNLHFFHGATDLGAVDLSETTFPLSPLFTNIATGELSPEATFTAENDLVFSLRNSPTQFLFGNYSFTVTALNVAGSSVTLLSTGFRQPANNSNGSALKVWALLPGGSMSQLMPHVGIVNYSHNENTVALFPNPCQSSLHLKGSMEAEQDVIVQFVDMVGKVIETHNMPVANGLVERVVATNELPYGLYIALIQSEKEVYRLPFVKER